MRSAGRKRRQPHPDDRQFAEKILDGLTQDPLHRTVYLGIQYLALPLEIAVGNAKSLLLAEDQELAQSFARFGDAALRVVREVEAPVGLKLSSGTGHKEPPRTSLR